MGLLCIYACVSFKVKCIIISIYGRHSETDTPYTQVEYLNGIYLLIRQSSKWKINFP